MFVRTKLRTQNTKYIIAEEVGTQCGLNILCEKMLGTLPHPWHQTDHHSGFQYCFWQTVLSALWFPNDFS